MEAAEISQNLKWQNEIAMLESRVQDCYEDIDLGNGDTIAVRTALSEEESRRYNDLEEQKNRFAQRLKELNKRKTDPSVTPEENQQIYDEIQGMVDEISTVAYQQIELVTANPLITTDWLLQNKDRWPSNDILAIMASFLEGNIRERVNRVKNIQSFLSK
jgi:hypothetical protein